MMHSLDFSSLHALLSTLLGLVLITLLGVGIRLLLMQTLQQRRERENRQINERLRALISAYRTLGGSFTGNLAVDPAHLRDLRRASMAVAAEVSNDDALAGKGAAIPVTSIADAAGSDRARRIRDSVESALADIILLGTEEQVALAAKAATEMAQGRLIHTSDLVVSLRDFIRGVLDLGPVPPTVSIPLQGPARPGGGKNAKDDANRKTDSAGAGGAKGQGMNEGALGGSGGAGGASAAADEPHHDPDAQGHE